MLLVSIGLAATACDTMIADRMIIRAPSPPTEPPPSATELLEVARSAFADCNLAEADVKLHRDTLHWGNRQDPPGLHVMIHPAGAELRVTLAQDLYGPIGPTDAYRCVKGRLRQRLEDKFGKGRVSMNP